MAVLHAYLQAFEEKPHAAFLWFEYWVAAGRRDKVDTVDDMLSKLTELIAELLTAVGVDDVDTRARAVVSYLLGCIVQQHVRPQPFAAIQIDIETLCLPGTTG